jgi:DNA-binding MarR family transcriptional regulator
MTASTQTAESLPADPSDITVVLDSVRILLRSIRLNNVDVERELGLSLAQLFVMQQLLRHDGSSVNDLAELTRTHQSSVSVVVRKLAERGFVEKRVSANDGRRAELSLTPAGRELLARSPATVQARLEDGLNQIGATRTRALAESLAEWLRRCGLHDAAPPMFFEDDTVRDSGSSHRS